MFEFECKEIKVKPMGEMKPCEIGVITDPDSKHEGEYVMRTASTYNFEVMNLSAPGTNKCWDNKCTLPVKIFHNCKLTLIIS